MRNLCLIPATLLLTGCATTGASTAPASGSGPQVVFETSLGNLIVEIDSAAAPISAQNMLAYVDAGFYDGTVFHRVISNFMIQGGGMTGDLKEKQTRAPIKNEADNGLKNRRGTLAMARTSIVDSATAQFFINVVDNRMLDHRDTTQAGYGYAVFGRVIEGMDVVDKIRDVPTCPTAGVQSCTQELPAGMTDVPAEPVTITRAYRKPF
ncbi:peptidylprolyl isomerase [Myxococcota bacterium]